ncbi:MAG: restriction endonuclease subunit S [Saprospiraceae bacterium]|nr:restriction endonuclease subunit S [Saprospiraceae bacterium]
MKKLIKDVANIHTGLFAKPVDTGEVVYLQSKHFDENGKLLNELHPDLFANSISEKHLLKNGDVIFAAKGTKNFAAVFEGHNLRAVASTSFFVLRISDRVLLPKYLAWFLNHPYTQAILKSNARGTAIPSIRKTVLDEMEIVIPALEKQIIILELSRLGNLETELRNQITALKRQLLEQTIINEINKNI